MFFEYGAKETAYLKKKDKRLGEVIERVGHLERKVYPDLFAALLFYIAGQQISGRALAAIWSRVLARFPTLNASGILSANPDELRALGLSERKIEYMRGVAMKVAEGELRLEELNTLSDAEIIARLTALKGIGVWTAEMLLLFSLCRPNVFSTGDLGIQRGLRMIYHHRVLTPAMLKRYAGRFSPYGSVAAFYVWEVAGGALPEYRDYAAPNRN